MIPVRGPFGEEPLWPDALFKALAPFWGMGEGHSSGVFPAINLYDDGEAFLLRAELPGANKDAFEVSVKGNQLTLRGERKINAPQTKANYHRREREGGTFRRVVTLPQPVDAERISATYRDGVLEVVLPRVAEAQPKKITIH